MKATPQNVLDAGLDHLRSLPFVERVELRPETKTLVGDRAGAREDGRLQIHAGGRAHPFRIEVVERRLDGMKLKAIQNMAAEQTTPPLLVVARLVPTEAGERLRAEGLAYVDAGGNCYLQLGRDKLAWIAGRHPPEWTNLTRGQRALGAQGYQVELALLADPKLLTQPIRAIGEAAAIGKTTVAEVLERLVDQRIVVGPDDARRLIDRRRLLDEWLAGYERLLRGKLLIGNFEARDAGEPDRLQARLTDALGDHERWGFGGGIAAMQWTQHWRGELTVVHHANPPADMARRLELTPARRGRILIYQAPFPAAIDVHAHLAHPLIVYAELLGEHDERAREAAEVVRRRFPEHFA